MNTKYLKIAAELFFALLMVFTFFIFPLHQIKMSNAAGETVNFIDLKPYYTHQEAIDYFKTLNAEGRQIHRLVTGKIDMMYPFVYGGLLMLILFSLIRKIIPKFKYLVVCPLLIMLLDFCENFNTLGMLKSYPSITSFQTTIGSTFTFFKWIALVMTLLLVLSLSLVYIYYFYKNRSKNV